MRIATCLTEFGRLLASLEPWNPYIQDQTPAGAASVSLNDRFADLGTPIRGLAFSNVPRGGDKFSTIMNAKEMESAMRNLGRNYGVPLSRAVNESYWGYKPLVAHISPRYRYSPDSYADASPDETYTSLITAGLHGRERGGPDSLIYFVADLLHAFEHDRDLKYGNVTYGNAQVRRVLKQGIILLPMTNPDGLVWDQQHNNCWGNNLNPQSRASKTDMRELEGLGVNIDRNFDVAWDSNRYFRKDVPDISSTNPKHELYRGKKVFSEAESRNVDAILKAHKKTLGWFMNVGTKSPSVRYPWAIDRTQSADPNQNWHNAAYDGKRGGRDGSYGEYMNGNNVETHRRVAERMAAQMERVGGKRVGRMGDPGKRLPASGTAVDYAYSQSVFDKSTDNVHSFKLQIGLTDEEAYMIALKGGCPYYPNVEQYRRSLAEGAVAYMEFLLAAAADVQ